MADRAGAAPRRAAAGAGPALSRRRRAAGRAMPWRRSCSPRSPGSTGGWRRSTSSRRRSRGARCRSTSRCPTRCARRCGWVRGRRVVPLAAAAQADPAQLRPARTRRRRRCPSSRASTRRCSPARRCSRRPPTRCVTWVPSSPGGCSPSCARPTRRAAASGWRRWRPLRSTTWRSRRCSPTSRRRDCWAISPRTIRCSRCWTTPHAGGSSSTATTRSSPRGRAGGSPWGSTRW